MTDQDTTNYVMKSEKWWREFEASIGGESDDLSYDHRLMLFLDAMMNRGYWEPSDPILFAADCYDSLRDEVKMTSKQEKIGEGER